MDPFQASRMRPPRPGHQPPDSVRGVLRSRARRLGSRAFPRSLPLRESQHQRRMGGTRVLRYLHSAWRGAFQGQGARSRHLCEIFGRESGAAGKVLSGLGVLKVC